MEEVFILSLQERDTIRNIIGKCSDEFKRDMTMKRTPLFDELQLLEALEIMKMQRWVCGDLYKLNDTDSEDKEEFEALDHIAKTSTGTMKEMALRDKRYLELKKKFASSEDRE